MMQLHFKKYISFLMVMVMFTLSVSGYCLSAHATELSFELTDEHATSYLSAKEKQCPSCPINEQIPHDCDSFCHCPCHALLTSQPVQIVCFRQITTSVFFELFKALPEVYLPKFVPPHILV